MTPQVVSMNLTRDELLALLQLMGSSSMNGLPEDPFAGVTKKERTERLNAGLETLINRGLVRAEGSDQAILDDTLVALVASCVVPSASMVLSGSPAQGDADPHFFNATPQIMVEHHLPRPAIHTFDFLPDAATLARRVAAVLAPLQSATAVSTLKGIWPDRLIGDVFRWARSLQSETAVKALIKAGWPADEAQAFVASCQGWTIYTGMCAWGLREERVAGTQTLIVVSNQQRCWLLEPQGQAEERLHVQAVTGEAAVQSLIQMTQPLATVAAAQ